jgi:hypothetical protein
MGGKGSIDFPHSTIRRPTDKEGAPILIFPKRYRCFHFFGLLGLYGQIGASAARLYDRHAMLRIEPEAVLTRPMS